MNRTATKSKSRSPLRRLASLATAAFASAALMGALAAPAGAAFGFESLDGEYDRQRSR